VFDRVDGFAFLDVPFDSASITHQPFVLFCSVCGGFAVGVRAAQLGKDLVEKGYTCNNTLVGVSLWTVLLSDCIQAAYLALP
jgi:hypothetical protein